MENMAVFFELLSTTCGTCVAIAVKDAGSSDDHKYQLIICLLSAFKQRIQGTCLGPFLSGSDGTNSVSRLD